MCPQNENEGGGAGKSERGIGKRQSESEMKGRERGEREKKMDEKKKDGWRDMSSLLSFLCLDAAKHATATCMKF